MFAPTIVEIGLYEPERQQWIAAAGRERGIAAAYGAGRCDERGWGGVHGLGGARQTLAMLLAAVGVIVR